MKANEHNTIETLLLSDGIFQSIHLPQRHCYIRLAESVQKKGGQILIFSMQHVTGEQLRQRTGVANIHHYPILEIEDEGDDAEEQIESEA
jgi:protein pelota